MSQSPTPAPHESGNELVVLTTARLRLEPWAQTDLQFFHELLNVPWVRKHLWDNTPITHEQILAAWEESQRTFFTHKFGLWKVTLSSEKVDIGFAGLRFVGNTDVIEVLYGLYPTFWKKGYATEAVRAVLDHGFRDLLLERVTAAAHPDNSASRRLIKRIGMMGYGFEHAFIDTLELYEIDREKYCQNSQT